MTDYPPIRYTAGFIKALAKLPQKAQDDFEKAVIFFRADPNDSRLHTKKLKGDLAGCYSIRINRDYRALFQLGGRRSVEFFFIAHRKDIYR